MEYSNDGPAAATLTAENVNNTPRRRPRADTPEYKRSIFERPEIRGLVADACQERINALQGSPEFGTAFVIHQLDEVINELRGEA